MRKDKKTSLFKLIYFALIIFLSFATDITPAHTSSPTVFVTSSWQDYLRMVPLSTGENFIPLVYAENGSVSDNIISFAEIYDGTLIALSESDIDLQIEGHWTRTDTVVVTQLQQQLAIYGSVIASALDIPLYIGSIPENTINNLGVQKIIVIGDVTVPDNLQKMHLANSADAHAYHKTLVRDNSFAALATPFDKMSFLAAEVVAYHDGILLFDSSEISVVKPDYLAWVTDPKYITAEDVQALYSASRYSDTRKIYDVNIGIITGFNAEDGSLLIARAYTFPQLDNTRKNHFVTGSMDASSALQETNNTHFTVTNVQGDSLTSKNLEQLLSTASSAVIEAHGSPFGLALADGSWPSTATSLNLPPLVFAAESCKTADLTPQNLENSIALRMVEYGAVAYIGSMEVGGVGLIGEYPFSFSTPDVPISMLVRLQNAARMTLDADIPRTILIGEPTFHQYDEELISYELHSSNTDTVTIHLVGQPYATPVVIEIPAETPINFAEAYSNSGERLQTYISGGLHFDQPLVSIVSGNRQTIFLNWPGGEGELILFRKALVTASLRKLFSNSLIGIEGIFIDIMTQAGVNWLLLFVGVLTFLRNWPETGSSEKDREKIGRGIIIGISMSSLAILYCVLLNFSIPWILVAAIGLGATASAWIADSQYPFSFLSWVKGICIFLAPPILVWGVVLLLGVSIKVHGLITFGLLVVGFLYGSISFLASQLVSTVSIFSKE